MPQEPAPPRTAEARDAHHLVRRALAEPEGSGAADALTGMVSNLVESRRFLANILESSTEYSIIAKDLERNVLSWNEGARRNYGYEADEVIGKHSNILHHPSDLESGIVDLLHRRALQEGHAEGTFRRQRKDGSTFTASVVITRRVDAEGRPIGYLLISRDITQEERLRRAAEEDRRRLAEADRRKDEFLATLAHELRNPLAPMAMAVELLKQPEPDAEARRGYVDIIDRQVAHMTRLVEDLLDVARISRGKIHIRNEPTDLVASVRQGVDLATPLIHQRRHHLVVDLPSKPVVVAGDLVRLAQAVGNLVQNAAKYTSPGGRIEVRLAREQDSAVLRVTDNGLGIPANLLEQVFEPFVQAHTHQEAGGLGLGLTLVKKIVEALGGTVTATSPGPGRGSQFTLRLPLHAPGPARPDREPHKPNVLVVDDNHDVANTLAALLRMEGADVAVAFGGQEGLDQARARKPDAVLCDLGMPDVDGYELARQLRNDPGFDECLLVAVSGHAQQPDRARSRAAGFEHHFAKPPDMKRLLDVIRQHVAARP